MTLIRATYCCRRHGDFQVMVSEPAPRKSPCPLVCEMRECHRPSPLVSPDRCDLIGILRFMGFIWKFYAVLFLGIADDLLALSRLKWRPSTGRPRWRWQR